MSIAAKREIQQHTKQNYRKKEKKMFRKNSKS